MPIRFLLVKHEGIAEIAYRFLSSIPNFNLSFVGLNSYGGSLYVGNTWYLSAMLISMLVLYPLLLWRYDFSTKLLFPLIALFFLGYMNGTDTPVYDWDGWAGLVSIGLLRGFAVIALGASLYPLSAFIIEKYSWLINPGSDQKALKIIVTLVKVSSYVIVIVYAFGSVFGQSFRQDFFYHAVMFCSLGVLLSFSNTGYCIPDSKMTRYLGKISLPVFMYHGFLRWAL